MGLRTGLRNEFPRGWWRSAPWWLAGLREIGLGVVAVVVTAALLRRAVRELRSRLARRPHDAGLRPHAAARTLPDRGDPAYEACRGHGSRPGAPTVLRFTPAARAAIRELRGSLEPPPGAGRFVVFGYASTRSMPMFIEGSCPFGGRSNSVRAWL